MKNRILSMLTLLVLFDIHVNASMSISISSNKGFVMCGGDSTTLCANVCSSTCTSTLTYEWRKDDTVLLGSSPCITVHSSGAYCVIVMCAGGCSGEQCVHIESGFSNYYSTVKNVTCSDTTHDGEIAIYPATNMFNTAPCRIYQLSSGTSCLNTAISTSSYKFTKLAPGNYCVKIIDTCNGNSCDTCICVTITQPLQDISYDTISACGSWSCGDSIYTSSGIFTCTSLNDSGCIKTQNVNLTIHPIPTLDIVGYAQNSCMSGGGMFTPCNGGVTVNLGGGTQPYVGTFDPPVVGFSSSVSINNFCAGSYVATVTDAAGCTVSTAVNIGFDSPCSSSNSILLNTGIDSNNAVVLTDGTFDSKWKVSELVPHVAGGSYIQNATYKKAVLTSNSAWVTNPTSHSISDKNPSYNYGGDLTFRREFKTCLNDTILFDFCAAYDNGINGIRIDGNLIANTINNSTSTSQYTSFHCYNFKKYLTPGTHTIDITIYNQFNSHGLNLNGSITGNLNSVVTNASQLTCCCPSLPIIGGYNPATVAAGLNINISPSATPLYANSLVAYASTNFSGILTVNPVSGVVTITNPTQAGTYVITVQAFGVGALTTSTTFTLTVTDPPCSEGLFVSAPNVVITDPVIQNTPLYFMSVGDFNNDGKQDMAVVNGSGFVAIRLGDGNGGFIGTTNIVVGSTYGPWYAEVSDVNIDGNQDLLINTTNSNSIRIFLGDGQGNFSFGSELFAGSFTTGIAIGDIDGNGTPDIAVANDLGFSVSIFKGDGAGNFTLFTTVPLPSGSQPHAIKFGDFNNDGLADLVTANWNNYNLSFRFGDGQGNFNNATFPFTNEMNVDAGCKPVDLEIVDINKDGIEDIVVANYTNSKVSIIKGNTGGGFTLMPAPSNLNYPQSQSIAIGDFNGDGNHDIIVDAGVAQLYLGDGNFGFTDKGFISGNPSYGVAVGDFNQDGRQDIASTSYGGTVYVSLGAKNNINVQGNNVTINDGDITPSLTDNTDFGNVVLNANMNQTYSIQNTGNSNLVVNSININGANGAMFLFGGISLPTIITANSSVTFNVTFTPTSVGLKTATINISSDDCEVGEYNFSIQGNSTSSSNTSTLNLTTYIQGYYVGAGTMQPVMLNQGVSGALATEVDDITVDLMNSTSPYSLAYSFTGRLMTNGTISCTFPAGAMGNSYYIRITHRNSIETWSASPVTITAVTAYDFSTSSSQAYGSNQIDIALDGVYSMYNGDPSQDGSIDIFDFLIWDTDNQAFSLGYLASDFNGDGNVDIFDFLVWDPNNQNFIGLVTP